MNLQKQPTLLKALEHIMADGIAAITLSTEEIFFLANDLCPHDQRIRYGTYLRFIHSFNEYGEPAENTPQTALLLEIHDYLQAQEARQKRNMLQAIKEGQKDWRRFVWLLQFRQKEERLKMAQAKQRERERKEQHKAAEAAAKQTTTQAQQPAITGQPQATPTNTAPPENKDWRYFKKSA